MATKHQTPISPGEDHETEETKPRAIVYQEVSLRDMPAPPGQPPESVLGDRVRYARNDLKLSIEALSRLTKSYDPQGTGLAPASISRYETGESLPGLREFRVLVEALDVPMGWLMYGTQVDKKPEHSEAEKLVLYALRSLISETRDDFKIENPVDTKWLMAAQRMDRLNKAKKPA